MRSSTCASVVVGSEEAICQLGAIFREKGWKSVDAIFDMCERGGRFRRSDLSTWGHFPREGLEKCGCDLRHVRAWWSVPKKRSVNLGPFSARRVGKVWMRSSTCASVVVGSEEAICQL